MRKINVFRESRKACYQLARDLKDLNEDGANVAISGGSSPILLFDIMREQFTASDFNNLKFFWVDERFVSQENRESNFGNFSRILIDNIISIKQVFPMYKHLSIKETIEKVTQEIKENVEFVNGYPSFDLIILGLGEDGHTASLFPDNLSALDSKEIIINTKHPQTKQERLTLTTNVINNAKRIVFLTLGEQKAFMLKSVLVEKDKKLPASHIKSDESVYWYLDKKASVLI